MYCDGERFLCPVSINNSQSFRQFICKERTKSDLDGCYSNSSYLEFIQTNNSEVTDVKISQCDAIYVIGCTKNYKNLSSLDISYSNYDSLNSYRLIHTLLKRLNVSNNELKEIPRRFFVEIPGITGVDFSHNKLTNIEQTTFEKAEKLTWINLANNQITEIDREVFENLTELEYLDVRENQFGQHFEFVTMKKLKELHFERNPIAYVPLVPFTTSMYVSWKLIWFVSTDQLGRKFRIVLNSQIEGLLRVENDYTKFHCNENSFEELVGFVAKPNQIENVHDLLLCLGSSIDRLELSGNFIGEVKSSTFSRFVNLTQLNLRETQLKNFDFNILKHQTTLNLLDISGNNLRIMENVSVLSIFSELRHFKIADNELQNIAEMIPYLTMNITLFDFSGNFVGEVDDTMFEIFGELKSLSLRNTSLRFTEWNPFELNEFLVYLDISDNNMSSMDFSILKETLGGLRTFFARGCNIGNSANVIKLFGSKLTRVDLSNNFLAEVNADTFNGTKLKEIDLVNANLTNFEFSENLAKLGDLNISYNRLTSLNFKIVMDDLSTIDLRDNHLVELVNFTRSRIPKQFSLAITNNNFSCEYLAKLMLHIEQDWPKLKFVGDQFNQKHGEDCRSYFVNQTKMIDNDILAEQNVPVEESIQSTAISFYSFVIGIPIFVVIGISVAYFALNGRFSKKTIANVKTEEERKVEKFEMSPVSTESPDDDEHIYEEIGRSIHNYMYDRLRFGVDAMPISTENHYHNATLLH